MLAINDNAVFQVNRGDAIASKPAPTGVGDGFEICVVVDPRHL
ncbi:hypothetical protein [Pseudomonas sp. PDM03]|nr:hypothetical protein [Pseudomonas sp. PDM03]